MYDVRHPFAIDSALHTLTGSTKQEHRKSLSTGDDRSLQSHCCRDTVGQSSLETVTANSWGTSGRDDMPVHGSIRQNPLSDSTLSIANPLEPGTYDVQVQGSLISPRHIAAGFSPTPDHDLVFQGGKTIANLQFANLYIGGAQSWNPNDIQAINGSLAAAMSDPRLNSVVAQYFPNQPISSTFLGSATIASNAPSEISQDSLENYISYLDQTGFFQGANLQSTVFNFMLPAGTVLSEGGSNSLEGLGAFMAQRMCRIRMGDSIRFTTRRGLLG